jgi:hypothetical protein
MCTKKLLAGLCAAGILLSCGCASVRVKTDLKPEADPKLASSAGKFYIAGLSYNCDAGYVHESPPPMDVAYEKNLLRPLRKECSARYPLLFSEASESAIPLFVTVEEEFKQSEFKTIAWMLGTLMIVPMILPAPFVDMDRDITVSAGVWNGTDSKGSGTVRSSFHRKHILWGTVLTPLALIPIPGESDFPKESSVFCMSRGGFDDIPQVAQQTATALAKMVVTKDAAYWTAQPRWTGSPASLSNPAPMSAPLPLPTQTVAPF